MAVILGLVLDVALLQRVSGQTSLDPAITLDLQNLRSRNARTVSFAILDLGNMASNSNGPHQELRSRAVAPLLQALRDSDAEIRQVAAFALGTIAGDGGGVTLAIDSGGPDFVAHRQAALPLAGTAAPDVSKALAGTLDDKVATVRQYAAQAIGGFGPGAAPYIPQLIHLVQDPETPVREAAAAALGRIGANPDLAVPALASALDSASAELAGERGGEVVALAPRAGAAGAYLDALAAFGPRAAACMPTLLNMLRAPQSAPRYFAARVLQNMGPAMVPAVPALLAALNDDDPETAIEVAAALARSNTFHEQALRVAIAVLHSQGGDSLGERWKARDERDRAAYVLSTFGANGAPALDPLGHSLNDPDEEVRPYAARAIGAIAAALRQAGRLDGLGPLRDLRKAIGTRDDLLARAAADDVDTAITALEKQQQSGVSGAAVRSWQFAPVLTALVAVYVALLCVWLALLWLAPLALLRIGEFVASLPRPKLPDWVGGIEMPLSSLFLVGFFLYRDRVLDAWTERALRSSTISGVDPAEAVSVVVGAGEPEALTPQSLRATFAAQRFCLAIVGDQHWSGSILRAVETWAMTQTPGLRLRNHKMLPIRVAQDDVMIGQISDGVLVDAVRDRMPEEAGTPSEPLVTALLRRQRVLLIAPNLHEWDESKRAALLINRQDFVARALVVTAQSEPKLNILKCTLVHQPLYHNNMPHRHATIPSLTT